jgi:hypothetical protein
LAGAGVPRVLRDMTISEMGLGSRPDGATADFGAIRGPEFAVIGNPLHG